MKQSLVFLLFSIFLLSGCGDATAPATNPPSENSDYSLSSDGKIATVSTSKGLKDMLATASVETIKLQSGTYDEDYEINDKKTIEGSSTTTINKISVNQSGAKISSPKITTLLAGKGIGDGELTLDNVTIEGDAVFQGGGANSIKVTGTSIFNGAVTLDKAGVSLKMGALTEIRKSLVVLQPASLMPIDTTADLPTITGSVVINYTEANSGATTINIKATNLVIGATVTNVTIEASAEIASLYTAVASIIIANSGKIESANDSSAITGVPADLIEAVDLSTNYELQEIIALSQFNISLFSELDINAIAGNFELPTTVFISDTISPSITWTSSNTEVLSFTNGTATVTQPNIATSVVLTASVTIGGITKTKDFTVNVLAKVNSDNLSKLPAEADGTWVMPNSTLSFIINTSKMTMSTSTYGVEYDKTTGQMYYIADSEYKIMTGLFWKDSTFINMGVALTKGTGTVTGTLLNLPADADGTWTMSGSPLFTISNSVMTTSDSQIFTIRYDSDNGQIYIITSDATSPMSETFWNGTVFTIKGILLTKGTGTDGGTSTGVYINLPTTANGSWGVGGVSVFSITDSSMLLEGNTFVIQYDQGSGELYTLITGNPIAMTGYVWNGTVFIVSGQTLTKL
ncbi:MAG: hypothetical protein A2015_04655 [Spirochaetes bacterium GWF1_31_7]|nr:MAG: hypothetical protein A2Y30_05035 [Spirochaetes bacterium GWE1_32_154]OHD48759.1 MAG: hypothetical protein A2Y29_03010 [Spirochaetes bacterium GWE2_31_10]OHD52822.1 MAG: hypothetical protein A2015_04655 [Spirochaetes bacterium GWF1_31_7]OHD76245.1 MAG: hypothetical protein A2355_07760 [Spirochaetes bacterium RIFOXYB1_FULL_32_8]HBD95200.1 hypothetical protein [Spirochaetia bacterium]